MTTEDDRAKWDVPTGAVAVMGAAILFAVLVVIPQVAGDRYLIRMASFATKSTGWNGRSLAPSVIVTFGRWTSSLKTQSA
jgi:hypothetical protein